MRSCSRLRNAHCLVSYKLVVEEWNAIRAQSVFCLSATFHELLCHPWPCMLLSLRSKAAFSDRLVLFVHDDVYIDDYFIRQRLNDALIKFDVVGVAGNKAPDLRQPSWALKWKPDGTFDGWQAP